MADAPAKQNLAVGVFAISTAFFFSALTGVLSKLMHGVSPPLIVFFEYAISTMIFLPLALRGGRRSLSTQHLPMCFVRSISGSFAQLLYFMSLRELSLLNASLLSNASPLFIPVIVWIWLRKPVGAIVWASLAIGLTGVVLVIHPSSEMFHDPATLIALASSIFSAIGLVTTNQLTKTEPPFRILAYNFSISTVLLIPVAAFVWQPVHLRQAGLLLALGLCFAATQWLIIAAYRYGSATQLSPFNYTVVIFSGLLGWVIFGTVPGLSAIMGTMLICAGGIASVESGPIEGLGHAIGSGHWFKHRFQHRAIPPA